MKKHNYKLDIQLTDFGDENHRDISKSTEGLTGENYPRKSNYRLVFITGGVVCLIIIAAVILGVAIYRSSGNSGNSPSEALEQDSNNTITTQPTANPIPVLTTTDPGKNWVDEPCQPQQSATCPWSSNPVLMVSMDGFRADYITRNLTPTLQKLATCGVHTPYMRPVYPTITFPNHYSIVTGLYPESHGIVDNNMYDPSTNSKFTLFGSDNLNPEWWGGEPIWTTAKKQGKKTASINWMGSYTNISGFLPDIYNIYNGSIPFEQRVDTVLDWLSWPDKYPPDITTLYFGQPDHVGHEKGPVSPEVDAMLERMDNIINRLMNGLYRKQIHNCVNVIVLADHGMESTSCDRRVFLSTFLDTRKYLIYAGQFARLHSEFHEKKDGNIEKNPNADSLEDVKKLLNCKSGHIQMFDKTNIPIRHHYMNNERIGDLLLDAQNRWTIKKNSKDSCNHGNHGFDNLYKSMQALFIAHGPDLKQQLQIEPFENIELYNLVCDLLKITPAPNNGTVGSLSHILKTTPTIPKSTTITSSQCTGSGSVTTSDPCLCKQQVKPSFPSNTSYTSLFGQPEMTSDNNVCLLSNNETLSGYSEALHMPVWTSYLLYKNMTMGNSGTSCIQLDSRISYLPCSSYSNSNKSISQNFIFNSGFSNQENRLNSDIVPMYDGFRDGIWNYTWKLILDYAGQRSGMEVIVGPAFDYKRDGLWENSNSDTKYVQDGGQVPLPTHYYIILITCKQGDITQCKTENLELLSFILPHIPTVPNCMPDEDYLLENVARIRDIELLTGIQFLTKLPVGLAARLRTFLPTSLWKPSKMSLKWKDVPCTAPNTTSCSGKMPLILISLDGFRADYVKRKLTPVIEKLRTCGVHTPYMRSVYPTVTFPNHYTIATGLYPESHGIISNNMYDKEIGEVFTLSSRTKGDPRWWGGEPIWITAKKQGKRANTFFWPGSDVNISGYYPDVWKAYDGKIGFPERLETVLEWITLPDDKRPDIITLYFDEPDHAGHQKGPDSELLNGQLETVDDMLDRLMNFLYQENLHDCINLIVIADHGMDHVSCSNLVKLPKYMPDDIKKVLAFDGTFGRIENDFERISKYKVKTDNVSHVPVSKITDDLMCKNPAMKVFTKDTIPKRFHYLYNERIGDVLLDMQDQWLVSDTNNFYCTGGNHGWDNLDKAMHALFLAYGPAFKQHLEIDPFENIELYNLMSEIIGIKPAPNNGTLGTLHHILSHPSTLQKVPVTNYTSDNISSVVPACGCSSVDTNSLDLSPVSSRHLPFGLPVSSSGSMYTKIYPGLALGYNDRNPLWLTLPLSQVGMNNNETCFMNDLTRKQLICDDFINTEKGISIQTLYNTESPIAGVYLLSSAVPMYNGFKSGIWDYVWRLIQDYSIQYRNISVTSGPIYDYNGDGLADTSFYNTSYVNSNSTVPVPTHFYIIIMKCKDTSQNLPCNTDIDVQSFILPHIQKTSNCLYNLDYLKDNVARIRDIELITGLQFLTKNIDQALAARLRTYLPVNIWPAELTKTWLDKPCTTEKDFCTSDYKPLILVSLDGFRADYLLRNFTPYVRKLSQCGVHAPYMRSVYPTKTFPNHYSIVTGLYPESHGIIDNNMYDPDIGELFGMSKPSAKNPRWWKGEPIWNTIKKNNKTAATFFWPGSDVKIQGMYPDFWKKYDGSIPFDSRVDELLSWLDLPADKRPDFATLYFDEPDHAGHSYGPDDIGMIGVALEKVDESVGRLMEGLYLRNLHNCANIIIIADHGMSDTACDRLITVRDYVDQYNNMYIYEGAFGRINPTIKYGRSHPKPVENPVPVSSIMNDMSCKNPHMKVFEKSQLPKRHHYANTQRIADIIVDVQDKWLFTFRSLHNYQEKYCRGGNHGYDNIYKSMNALFLAHGPSFKQNLIVEPFENIELYNLMSVVLNVTAAPNNGTEGSLYHLLHNPPPTLTVQPDVDYIRNNSDSVDITLSSECLKRCPSFGNLTQSDRLERNEAERKHTPFGIPLLKSYPRQGVDLLYQTTHITSYDSDVHSPVWVSYTVNNPGSTISDSVGQECVLPDKRVKTTSVDQTICSTASNLPTDYIWTSLRIHDQSKAYDRLSSVFVPVYKNFYSGIWSHVKEKIKQWSSKYGKVNIISGPAYDYNYDGLPDSKDTVNRYLNDTDIIIPSHIYLIVTRCDSGQTTLTTCTKLKTISFILPNIQNDNNCQTTDNYLTDNEARIRDIELLTGLQFFVNYNNHVELRTFLPRGLWSV